MQEGEATLSRSLMGQGSSEGNHWVQEHRAIFNKSRSKSYAYTYLQMYTHMHILTYTHIHIYAYAYAHIHIHKHTYSYTHICIQYAHAYICIHIHMHTETHTHTYTHRETILLGQGKTHLCKQWQLKSKFWALKILTSIHPAASLIFLLPENMQKEHCS